MAFSFIHFCVCVCDWKKEKNTRIGLEITQRHSYETFQKRFDVFIFWLDHRNGPNLFQKWKETKFNVRQISLTVLFLFLAVASTDTHMTHDVREKLKIISINRILNYFSFGGWLAISSIDRPPRRFPNLIWWILVARRDGRLRLFSVKEEELFLYFLLLLISWVSYRIERGRKHGQYVEMGGGTLWQDVVGRKVSLSWTAKITIKRRNNNAGREYSAGIVK